MVCGLYGVLCIEQRQHVAVKTRLLRRSLLQCGEEMMMQGMLFLMMPLEYVFN